MLIDMVKNKIGENRVDLKYQPVYSNGMTTSDFKPVYCLHYGGECTLRD